MRMIFKYPIECNSVKNDAFMIRVDMPVGAKPLSVQCQNDRVCIWAEVDPTVKSLTEHQFYCVGTGHGAVPEWPGVSFFGTVQIGAYVWHIYY